MIDEGWFGPTVTDAARSRLGDVALVAKGTVAFHDPDDTGPFELISPARLAHLGRDAGAAAGAPRLIARHDAPPCRRRSRAHA